MPATNPYRTINEKLPINLNGYQGAIEHSSPKPFRGFVFIPELDMIAESYGRSIEEVKTNLIARIDELKEIVPARRRALQQIDTLLNKKFTSLFFGYKFLNSLQKEWRSAPLPRLRELILELECIDMAD